MSKSEVPKLHPRRATYRTRRLATVLAALVALGALIIAHPNSYEDGEPLAANSSTLGVSATSSSDASSSSDAASASGSSDDATSAHTSATSGAPLASEILSRLEIKGRAPKTGYARTEFYSTWPTVDGCNLRQRILKRELGDTAQLADDKCTVISGEFDEPYTGEHQVFSVKSDLSNGLQIDHVVALSDAWQKGAQYFSAETRYALATDPLNLLAVDASANQQKSDGDAATWLPSNKSFRCQYVARQVSVKYKYGLWVTQAEHDAIAGILAKCPNEPAVGVE